MHILSPDHGKQEQDTRKTSCTIEDASVSFIRSIMLLRKLLTRAISFIQSVSRSCSHYPTQQSQSTNTSIQTPLLTLPSPTLPYSHSFHSRLHLSNSSLNLSTTSLSLPLFSTSSRYILTRRYL